MKTTKNANDSERTPFTVVNLNGNIIRLSDTSIGNIEEQFSCFDDVADEHLIVVDTETDARFFCHAEKVEYCPFPNMTEKYIKLSIIGKGYSVSCDIGKYEMGVFIIDTNTLKMSGNAEYNMLNPSNDCTSSLLKLTEIGITVENIKILSAIINTYMRNYRRKYCS